MRRRAARHPCACRRYGIRARHQVSNRQYHVPSRVLQARFVRACVRLLGDALNLLRSDRDAYLPRHRRGRVPRFAPVRLPAGRGDRVICVDNLETGSLANIEHIRGRDFVFVNHDMIEPHRDPRAGRLRLPPRQPGEPDRLPAAAAAHAQGRLLRYAQRARPRQGEARPLPARVDQRGLRRPAGPPADRGLLGPREPDRPARRLRRGEALRRGADDGLPPPAGCRHLHRPDLQHLRPSHAAARRPGDPDVHAPGPRGQAADRLRRRLPDAQLLLRRRPRPRASSLLAESGEHLPVNIGNPTEFTLLELAETVVAVTGSSSEIVFEALPVDDPKSPAGHHPRPRAARLGAEVQLRDGLRRTIEASGAEALLGSGLLAGPFDLVTRSNTRAHGDDTREYGNEQQEAAADARG